MYENISSASYTEQLSKHHLVLWSEKTREETFAHCWWYHCLHRLHCAMLPSLESLDQGRQHLQYTGTVYSDLILCFEQTGFMVESGNTIMSWFSKQLTRWFLISDWFLRWAAGVHIIIDVYHNRWTVDVADTHPVRIANVDYLDKAIRTWVPAHISQIQCVLQPGLFWKILMQKNLYCTDMLLHKPFIWQDNFLCSPSLEPRPLIRKNAAWQLTRVQTADFRCPGVGSTNQISESFTWQL